MATYAEATIERDRLMNTFVGVTARVVPLSSAYGVEVHDVRPSGLKSAQQLVGLALGTANDGETIAWSEPAEDTAWASVYT